MVHVRRALQTRTFRACLLAGAALLCAPQNSHAQLSPVIDSAANGVVVDLSVLEDSGIGRASPGAQTPPLVRRGRGLLMPGNAMPKSQLHVRPIKAKPATGLKAPVLIPPTRVAKPAPKPAPKTMPTSSLASAPSSKPAAQSTRRTPMTPPPPAAAPKPIDQKIKPKMVAKVPAMKAAPPPPKAKAAPPPPPKAPAPKVTKTMPPAPVKMTPKPVKVAKEVQAPKSVPAKPPVALKAATSAPPVAAKAPPAPTAPATKQASKVTIPLPTAPKQGTQTASRPPSANVKGGDLLRVAFPAGEAKLPADVRAGLAAMAEKLATKKSLRLQLKAYAGGDDLSSSKARRLSLSRALSVRSYLIEKGVRSTRIDVRALGNKTSEEPVNRVDLNVIER